MNVFNLDSRTRILLLKMVLAGIVGASVFSGIRTTYLLGELNEKHKAAVKLAKLNNKVVKRFMELAPDEVCMKIYDEFAFDVVTLGFEEES
jgi:hypoxanthine-guanine phosphoribosyltransferase